MSIASKRKNNLLLLLMQGAASLIDGIILGLIYLSFLIPVMLEFMLVLGRFIFMPISILMQACRVVLLWVECAREKFPTKKVVTTTADTIVTILFAIAVLGGIFAASAFALAAPVIFSATCFANTVFHAALSIYYFVRANKESSPEKAKELKAAAIENAIATLVGVIATIAITGVMVFGAVYCAPLGLMVGIFVVAMSVMGMVSTVNEMRKPKEPTSDDEPLIDLIEAPQNQRITQRPRYRAPTYSQVNQPNHFYFRRLITQTPEPIISMKLHVAP